MQNNGYLGNWLGKDTRETLGARNIFCPYLSGYTVAHICKFSLSSKLKINPFVCVCVPINYSSKKKNIFKWKKTIMQK